MSTELRKRLLQDIAELQQNPYPNIRLHVDDEDLTRMCLVLSPEGFKTLHLTVRIHDQYPLSAPDISMDTNVRHPNVFGTYICASILNTQEGYTPAYTLKGIAIQLLSFFGSDSIEQSYGSKVSLDRYRNQDTELDYDFVESWDDPQRQRWPNNTCPKCKFSGGKPGASLRTSRAPLASFVVGANFYDDASTPPKGSRRSRRSPRSPSASPSSTSSASTVSTALTAASEIPCTRADPARFFISRLPSEILLQISESLVFEDLTKFARAWDRVSGLITEFDVIRTRELQCFVLKENYTKRKLGVGVSVVQAGRQGTLQSEFDILSAAAFTSHDVRASIHNIPFSHWLPLPISYGHWQRVKDDADAALASLAVEARIASPTLVLYAFMNDVIVRLNRDLDQRNERWDVNASKSTLRHASEKAIESYFHLFHLLLCMATSKPSIVRDANRMINSFMAGKTSKDDVPNLGYLLIALLISDIEPTESLMKKIVTEAITRNVVWLLDAKGAGMAELGCLESEPISEYRLKKTFEGSRTSYRLLMFSELFRRTARPSPPKAAATVTSTPMPQTQSYNAAAATANPSPAATRPIARKSLAQLRDELFRRHGGPPPGAAAHLASEVRRLQRIDDFPNFLREMGITIPSRSNFTQVLRDTVKASAAKGYSRPLGGYVAASLAVLRLDRDPEMQRSTIPKGLGELPSLVKVLGDLARGRISFFPVRDAGRPGAGRGSGRGRRFGSGRNN
ncbi:hypothetical protein OQA88_8207 [Cercophora sp. LCS_1]